MPRSDKRRSPRPGVQAKAMALAAAAFAVGINGAVRAQIAAETVTGVPQQILPAYPEPGAPVFTITPGSPLFGGATAGTNGGAGGGNGAAVGAGGNPLDVMMAQDWGSAAVGNAQALGVNPAALAATCVLESGCQNVGSSGGSSASGAFQMISSTYTADLNAALAANPSLAGQVTAGAGGQMDPATEAIAAAQDLRSAALGLQAAGIATPTVLDVRGAYNFGAAYAAPLALADNSALMSQVLSGTSASTLAANGITAGMTVGQWRQTITNQIGTAASQPVLVSQT